MKKIDELADPRSCLNHAADNEPLFVLRANDELAPLVVAWWADRYAATKGGYPTMTPLQRAKCDEAAALARQMIEWKRDQLNPQPPSTDTAA